MENFSKINKRGGTIIWYSRVTTNDCLFSSVVSQFFERKQREKVANETVANRPQTFSAAATQRGHNFLRHHVKVLAAVIKAALSHVSF